MTNCHGLKMTAPDGKKRMTDVVDTTNLLRLIQSIPSPKAEPFKMWLAALEETCSMDVEMVKGAKNIFFGGEGLFLTRVTGPGKVYLQSMPIVNVAGAISAYITPPSSDSGIKINLGEH